MNDNQQLFGRTLIRRGIHANLHEAAIGQRLSQLPAQPQPPQAALTQPPESELQPSGWAGSLGQQVEMAKRLESGELNR